MTTLPETFEFLADPSHGWLIVDASDLAAVGLTEADISRYSYRRGDLIGLEEDADAARFITAYHRTTGNFPSIRERAGTCRGWARFGRGTDPFAGIDFDLLARMNGRAA